MTRPLTVVLLAAALATGASAVSAQEVVEPLRTAVDSGEQYDRIDTDAPMRSYSATDDYETRPACISVFSCGTADGDDPSTTDNPRCILFSGWALDECLGVDRGGHSRGKYL